MSRLLVAWMALTMASAARAQAVDADVRIELSQPRVTHEPGREISATVIVRDSAGQPRAGTRPVLDVSTGTLGPLEEKGEGRFVARYRLPAERHPQPVLFAAKVPGRPPVWTVLSICGRTELPVDSDKPSVMVTLRIGGRTFGPVRTDERGRVRVPVEVCPGDAEAVAEALDDFGNSTRKMVTIPIPPSPVLVGFAEKETLAADGSDGSDVFLLVIGQDGRPVPRITFLAARTAGAVSPVKRLTPGLYRLRYTAPGGLASKQAVLTVTTREFPGLGKREFRFSLVPGAPAALSLSAVPERFTNDGRGAAELQLLVRDGGGTGLAGLRPRLFCDGGAVGEVRDAGAGVYRAGFVPTPGIHGTVECGAELSGEAGTLRARAAFLLERPVPGRLRIRMTPDSLPADGQATARIEMELADERGVPLAGEKIVLSAPLGRLGAVVDDGQGRYHAEFRVPLRREDTRLRIHASSSERPEVEAAAVIELQGQQPPPPPAPRWTLGTFGGITSNFGRLFFGQFLLEASLRLPWTRQAAYLALETGYRAGQRTVATELAGFEVRLRAELIPLHLLLCLRLMPRSSFTPLVFAGGGPQFWKWSQRGADGFSSASFGTAWGALAGLGAEGRLGPGALALHVRYHYAYLSSRAGLAQETAQEGPRANGNLGGLEVSLGYRLFF